MYGEDILKLLPVRIRCMVEKLQLDYSRLWEIRLRVNSPFILRYEEAEIYVDAQGRRTSLMKNAYVITARDVNDTLECVCNHSLYAYEDEIRQGFVTVCGGHRVGVAGKIILDGNRIKCIRHISFLNIRVAHEIKGCSRQVMPYIYGDGRVFNTLIVSAPCHGKTTLLRDIVRVVSDDGITVGVVDERSEIAACYKGVPQNDVGMRTDVLDCCPKAAGMMMLVRTMAPDLIAVDEIGGPQDVDAIFGVVNCGCRLLATAHGYSIDDVRNRAGIRKLVENRVFERYVVLGGNMAGQVSDIFDGQGNRLCWCE